MYIYIKRLAVGVRYLLIRRQHSASRARDLRVRAIGRATLTGTACGGSGLWRTVSLMLCLLAGPALADPAAEVQRRVDAAGALPSDTLEAALERVLLLREAEGIVEDVLSAGPPKREDWPLVSQEARAERATLRDAAAKDFAPFCEGREPRECLLAEAEALLAEAPELDNRTKWGGNVGQAAARSKSAVLLAEAGHFAEAEQMAVRIGPSFDRNVALGEVALLLARDGQVLRAFTLLEAVDEPDQLINAIFDLIRPPLAPDVGAVIPDGPDERLAALAAVKRAAELSSSLMDTEQRDRGWFDAAALYLRLADTQAATALIDQIDDGWLNPVWLNQLAFSRIKAGEFAEAERLAETIAEANPDWALPYSNLTDGLAAAGQHTEARRVVGLLKTPEAQAIGLLSVARAIAPFDAGVSAECLAEAEVLAAGIADPEGRVSTLGWVGEALAESGAGDRAEALAERLANEGAGPDTTSLALRVIASALRDAGKMEVASRLFDAAEGQAGLVEGEWDRDFLLHELAVARIEAGQYAEAERAAAGIAGSFNRLSALKEVAVAQAVAGEHAEALRIAGAIGAIEVQEALQESRLVEVAKALALAGDVTGAEAVADGIVEPVRRSEAMAGVAIALAEGGQLVEAWRISGLVEDAAWRAVAVAAVAARL
jgi:tetratricopeptide (TPR) repeat protein